MFHPVGNLPPRTYWRRRVLFLCGLVIAVVLMALTFRAAAGRGSNASADATRTPSATPSTHSSAQNPPPQSSAKTTRSSAGSAHATTRANTSAPRSSTPPSSPPPASSHTAATPKSCDVRTLNVAAATQKPTYTVGQQPMLYLEVLNPGPGPCVQDVADPQVELLIYNGGARVWGSHDCQIQPGTNLVTLAVDKPLRLAVTWTGLSSQPHCAGIRQRVGAGTYTLRALLAGREGAPTTFQIT